MVLLPSSPTSSEFVLKSHCVFSHHLIQGPLSLVVLVYLSFSFVNFYVLFYLWKMVHRVPRETVLYHKVRFGKSSPTRPPSPSSVLKPPHPPLPFKSTLMSPVVVPLPNQLFRVLDD